MNWANVQQLGHHPGSAPDLTEPATSLRSVQALSETKGFKNLSGLPNPIRILKMTNGLRHKYVDSDAITAPDFNLEHHQLMALIASRAFLLPADDPADNDRRWAFVETVMPVYQLLDASAAIGWFNPHLGHRYPLNARSVAGSFIDKHLNPRFIGEN